MKKWFKEQAPVIQVLLLLIPGVNHIFEIILRWENAYKKQTTFNIAVAVGSIFVGTILGWVDLFWFYQLKDFIMYE